MGQVTLPECKDLCTQIGCPAFSFYEESYIIPGGLVGRSCAICGYPTILVNGTDIVDGNYSSVLSPGLLREANMHWNIYQPVHTQSPADEPTCDAGGVQQWLQSEIFAPVLAEANASAGGALNTTRRAQLLALLTADVQGNLSHAAEDCSMPEVNTLALLDEARAVLLAAGATTPGCEAFTAHLESVAFAPALGELNASMYGALNGTHADVLHVLLEQQLLPGLLANTSTCDPAHVSNATLETKAQAFASELVQHPVFAGLFVHVPAPGEFCAALLNLVAAQSTTGMLEDLNATAGGALNGTHAAALGQLVQQHLVSPVAESAINCSDLAAVSAAMQLNALQLQVALAQHTLFQAYNTLPEDAKVVVKMTVRLGMSPAQFNAEPRRQYRTGIASACGVAVEDVRITAVRVAGARRRRLLQNASQEGIEVDTQIDTPAVEALAVLAAAGNMTAVQEGVGTHMGPEVSVQTLSAPTLVEPTEPTEPTPAPVAQKPKSNYQGQNSAVSKHNGSRNVFFVVILLMLLVLLVTILYFLSMLRSDKTYCMRMPSQFPQVAPAVQAQMCYADPAVPEEQKLLQTIVPGDAYAPSYAYFQRYP